MKYTITIVNNRDYKAPYFANGPWDLGEALKTLYQSCAIDGELLVRIEEKAEEADPAEEE